MEGVKLVDISLKIYYNITVNQKKEVNIMVVIETVEGEKFNCFTLRKIRRRL